jgi:23S rRNA (guanosine2251-2'-O)-methyltransferase
MYLEGQQSVLAALQARRRKFEIILIKAGSQPERLKEITDEAEQQNIPIKFIPKNELDQLTQAGSHGGVVAMCSHQQHYQLEDLDKIFRRRPGFPFVLILEGIEDQQHLGYILRSAEALGAHAVLLKKHLWKFNETALARTSSGAFERIPLIKISEAAQVKKLFTFDIRLLGCIAGAKKIMYEEDFNLPVALAVGGEKRGLSGKLREECNRFIRIPMVPGSASSLSLTHAACLLMGEVARQRFAAINAINLNNS